MTLMNGLTIEVTYPAHYTERQVEETSARLKAALRAVPDPAVIDTAPSIRVIR